jgi:hypothetical protein
MTPENEEALECLEGPDGCGGSVEMRNPGYGYRSFPRCEKHGEARVEREAENRQRYPVLQPDDFDELDAGEAWDE